MDWMLNQTGQNIIQANYASGNKSKIQSNLNWICWVYFQDIRKDSLIHCWFGFIQLLLKLIGIDSLRQNILNSNSTNNWISNQPANSLLIKFYYVDYGLIWLLNFNLASCNWFRNAFRNQWSQDWNEASSHELLLL